MTARVDPGTVPAVSATQLRPALWLSLWSFFVWTTRIRNIWTDDTMSTGDQVGRTALALVFTGFAAVTVAAWWRARQTDAAAAWVPRWVRAFAIWTTGVWVVRAVQIATADHEAAFIAVHVVLALVSISLAVWADRRAGPAPR